MKNKAMLTPLAASDHTNYHKKMDTNDPSFEWFRVELRAIKSKRFHIFRTIQDADFDYRVQGKGFRLQGAFLSFLREFGWALLYTDHNDAPLVSVYPLNSERRFVLADGDVYIGFGYKGQRSAFFRESLILATGSSPVFEEVGKTVTMVNDSFEDWLQESCIWARSTFSEKAWKKIVDGPKPFSEKEQRIVAARAQFNWRHVGFAPNGDAIFEVSNESSLRLPYLSIGVQGKGGTKLVGGVWLNVSDIEPGGSGFVQQDCYKDKLRPDELEVFDLEDPIPEKRERYWEFKKVKATNQT